MRIRSLLFGAGATVTLISSIFMFQAAYASAYEWLSWETFVATDGSCCTSGENLTIKWDVNTDANYYEYRNAYYATTSIYNPYPPPDSAWREYGNGVCRHEGYVSKRLRDDCYPLDALYHKLPNVRRLYANAEHLKLRRYVYDNVYALRILK